MSEPPDYLAAKDSGTVVSVFVQPRAAKDAIVGVQGRALKIKLTAPPVDDRANRSLVSFVAGIAGVPRSSVKLLSGHSSRTKKVFVPLPLEEMTVRFKVLEGGAASR